jgi:8-oxo-dGTP pyrophosphatase MutT (NUDIX family)
MPHIHELFDFVVSVFITHRGKILLVHHKSYGRWLPIGGHIELDEDPEQALYREIREECGLKVKILAPKPPVSHAGVRAMPTPSFVDVHHIRENHRHIAFVYFGTASHPRVKLHEREHAEFRWFTEKELSDRRWALTKSIRFYCRAALRASRK